MIDAAASGANGRSGAGLARSHGGDLSGRPAMELGGGGLVSTVDDLDAFGRMLLGQGRYDGRRILSPECVALMVSDQVPPHVKAASPFFPGFWDTHGWGSRSSPRRTPSRPVPAASAGGAAPPSSPTRPATRSRC